MTGGKFHTLFDSISDAIFITGMDGRFILVNSSACECLGYSQEELLQMGPADIDTPEYAAKVPERINALQEHGKLVFESAHVRKDGVVIPIELNNRIIDYDGRPAIMAVARDITERKQAEAEKEAMKSEAIEVRALLQTVLDSTPDWVFAKDRNYRFIFVNRAFATAQGYAPQDMIGRPDTDFWSDELCNGDPARGIRGFHADDDAAMAGNLTHNPDDPATLANGELRIFDTLKMPLRDTNGHCYGVLAYARDVTDRKDTERQLRNLAAHLQTVREKEKASIAREIHDDLGGMLTALKMEAYWLKTELSANKATIPLLDRVGEMSQLINNAADVMRNIITGLRPAILDDLGLVAALEWQAAQFHKHTGIECRVNCVCEKSEDCVKELDKPRSVALFRISQEALTNVARHSGASRVEIEFHRNDEEIVMSVIDNGRGMTENHTAASIPYGILGMRERADQLGGKIIFGPTPGGGFNLTVILPLPANEEET